MEAFNAKLSAFAFFAISASESPNTTSSVSVLMLKVSCASTAALDAAVVFTCFLLESLTLNIASLVCRLKRNFAASLTWRSRFSRTFPRILPQRCHAGRFLVSVRNRHALCGCDKQETSRMDCLGSSATSSADVLTAAKRECGLQALAHVGEIFCAQTSAAICRGGSCVLRENIHVILLHLRDYGVNRRQIDSRRDARGVSDSGRAVESV